MGSLLPATMDNVQSIRNIERIGGFTIYPGRLTAPVVTMGLFLSSTKKSESNFLLGASQFPKKHCFLEGSHAFLFCPSDTSNIWMKKGMAHR